MLGSWGAVSQPPDVTSTDSRPLIQVLVDHSKCKRLGDKGICKKECSQVFGISISLLSTPYADYLPRILHSVMSSSSSDVPVTYHRPYSSPETMVIVISTCFGLSTTTVILRFISRFSLKSK